MVDFPSDRRHFVSCSCRLHCEQRATITWNASGLVLSPPLGKQVGMRDRRTRNDYTEDNLLPLPNAYWGFMLARFCLPQAPLTKHCTRTKPNVHKYTSTQ